MSETLSVSAIEFGSVIDHIPAGQAIKIIQCLSIGNQGLPMTLGLNLPSNRLGKKDMIKLSSVHLTQLQANDISIFAPQATINLIKDYNVASKVKITLPERIEGIFTCNNNQCISRHEPVKSLFFVRSLSGEVHLTCHYCEKPYFHQ